MASTTQPTETLPQQLVFETTATEFWLTASQDTLETVCSGYMRLKIDEFNMIIRIDDIKNIVEKYLIDHNVLSVCGFFDKILNNGKRFFSHQSCLARTNIAMIANCGIYNIRWKVEKATYYGGVGICTDWYKTGMSQSQAAWFKSLFHIGWCSYLDPKETPNRLLCGGTNKHLNVFNITSNFVGDRPLSKYKDGDIIGLIYDSNNNSLKFEHNGQLQKSYLTDIPSNYKLFWFVAHCGNVSRFSILNI